MNTAIRYFEHDGTSCDAPAPGGWTLREGSEQARLSDAAVLAATRALRGDYRHIDLCLATERARREARAAWVASRLAELAEKYALAEGDELRANDETGHLYPVRAGERMGNRSEAEDPIVCRRKDGRLTTTVRGAMLYL